MYSQSVLNFSTMMYTRNEFTGVYRLFHKKNTNPFLVYFHCLFKIVSLWLQTPQCEVIIEILLRQYLEELTCWLFWTELRGTVFKTNFINFGNSQKLSETQKCFFSQETAHNLGTIRYCFKTEQLPKVLIVVLKPLP